MIIGQVEGNLVGDVVIKLSKTISKAKYKTTFEIRNENGTYYSFLPPFPVFQHENYLEFNVMEFSKVYLKVTVEYIEETATWVSNNCNPCNSLF